MISIPKILNASRTIVSIIDTSRTIHITDVTSLSSLVSKVARRTRIQTRRIISKEISQINSRQSTRRTVCGTVVTRTTVQITKHTNIRNTHITKPSQTTLVTCVVALPHSHCNIRQTQVALSCRRPETLRTGPMTRSIDNHKLLENPLVTCIGLVIIERECNSSICLVPSIKLSYSIPIFHPITVFTIFLRLHLGRPVQLVNISLRQTTTSSSQSVSSRRVPITTTRPLSIIRYYPEVGVHLKKRHSNSTTRSDSDCLGSEWTKSRKRRTVRCGGISRTHHQPSPQVCCFVSSVEVIGTVGSASGSKRHPVGKALIITAINSVVVAACSRANHRTKLFYCPSSRYQEKKDDRAPHQLSHSPINK